ncbi:alkaline phosphatase PhoX, partial [uncultured Marinobacter sp.]|uniref:PhoX family protein n=1 Tax=uncultured Marinobacter sp. TaxID=187379 RepID=UPI0030DD53D6
TDLVRTRYSTDGTRTRGTINNCAHGVTPWNTYLTCEENWAGYFVNKGVRNKEQQRYGVRTTNGRYSWELADSGADEYIRFDVTAGAGAATDDYRNEANTFGWIVEVDPFNPESVPQKRTALGRFAHEGIIFHEAIEGEPVVAYSGDDSRFEYVYKFVSSQPYYSSSAGGYLLNEGTLYAGKFNEDGSGEWLPLSMDDAEFIAKMNAAVGTTVGDISFDAAFADQAELLMNARLAADIAGATKMDRPEWGAINPRNRDVYFALTNNTSRGEDETDAPNPRANSITGHIIRWTETDSDPKSETFAWDIFVMAGNAEGLTADGFEKEEGKNLVTGETLTEDATFAAPDGLWFDQNGTLWIQTDMSGSLLRGEGNAGNFGNNMMLAADPESGEIKRFLTGPTQCEVTGVVSTPDGKTMFVNIQHPGDTSTVGNFTSNWPEGGNSRPRSSTVVITKDDGGLIGS